MCNQRKASSSSPVLRLTMNECELDYKNTENHDVNLKDTSIFGIKITSYSVIYHGISQSH
ncbi:hypothetical protein XBI1_1740016 [Xenorhabdus bovienii str. Intermedium]|uniref:Uncharacterized protein n=1 Tax=Xenorhabdus bovienii str. Intermedium TaxID=1379677 RepID=A0A077QFI3_XENBV|nr:hypothetical protein XBI1_1740016 [Xenorhabdus bovienii str. Intermedium]